MAGPVPTGAGDTAGQQARRVLVLGANGPSGRQVVRQALERGLHVEALTRHPEAFPLRHERLHVVAGDATDPATIDAAVAPCEAVISVIGAAFTRRRVQVYSTSARLVADAMARHGQRRLLVVTSAGLTPASALPDLSRAARAARALLRRTVGRTVYDDMEHMEATVAASDLDWTIVRPPGLTDQPGPGYAVAETSITGPYCARDDLAAMLLDHLDDHRYLRRVAAVASPGLHVSAAQTFQRELLKR